MAPTTEISLPHIPEHEVVGFENLMKELAKEKNPGVTHELMRFLDRILSECEFQVRVLEAIKNGHNRPQYDPKMFKVKLKSKHTYNQLMMKLWRVKHRLYDMELYYDILNEPYEPQVPTPYGTEKDRFLYLEVDELKRHIYRLYAYLNPQDKLCVNFQKEEVPDNLPHVEGPLNLEEARRNKKIALEKFEKECEEGRKKWRALTPEQRAAIHEANMRKIYDSLGVVRNEDGSYSRKESESEKARKRKKSSRVGKVQRRKTRERKAKKAI